jgi:hypothetical protein
MTICYVFLQVETQAEDGEAGGHDGRGDKQEDSSPCFVN